jgi:hypothetical protein
MGPESVDATFDAQPAKHTAPCFSIGLLSGANHQGVDDTRPSSDNAPNGILNVDDAAGHVPSLPHLLHRLMQVPVGLQAHPELRRRLQQTGKPQCGVCRDAPFAEDNLVQTIQRNAEALRRT